MSSNTSLEEQRDRFAAWLTQSEDAKQAAMAKADEFKLKAVKQGALCQQVTFEARCSSPDGH